MLSRSQIKKFADEKIDSGRHHLAQFQERFSVNPLMAFEYSDNAIRGSAEVEVGLYLINLLDNATTDEAFLEIMTDRALTGAQFPERSTSVTSNLAKTYVTAVWAELAKKAFDRKRFSR